MKPVRPIAIESRLLSQHYYLNPQDECAYYLEYTAGQGYAGSPGNQLIINFKKEMDRRGRWEWRYKERAIVEVKDYLLRSGIDWSRYTIVPVPPSKCRTDPMYDPRLEQSLQLLCRECDGAQYMPLIEQKESMNAAHGSARRPTPEELKAAYEIIPHNPQDVRSEIMVFDDVIAAGSHFRAVSDTLAALYPDRRISGLFVARRICPDSEDVIKDFL